MHKILVAGIDTIAGASLAAWLAGRHQVIGLSWRKPVSVAGCETAACDGRSEAAAEEWIEQARPDMVVGCGAAAESSWQPAAERLAHEDVSQLPSWALAARGYGARFTLLSSDAVFTGPWMFHRETSNCFCDSPEARSIRQTEAEVAAACPESLIVRTNAFGWSPRADLPGLCETVIEALENGRPLSLECTRHGTPILATDLAEVLERAWEHSLQGLYHIAGGERVSPFRFACLLGDQLGLPTSSLVPAENAPERRREFGTGEASLQTRRIRKTLDLPLPLIREGLARLCEQHESGYRDRFGSTVPAPARAA